LFDVAIEKFTTVLEESSPLPPLCQMFAILRKERAEAFILSRNFVDALYDCQEVIKYQRDYAPVWILRAEILLFLGKPEEAKNELSMARNSCTAYDPEIEDAYYRADFETRIVRVNNDVINMLQQLNAGTYEIDDNDDNLSVPSRLDLLDRPNVQPGNTLQSPRNSEKMTNRRSMSHIESRPYGSDNVQLHRPNEELKKPNKDVRRKKTPVSNDTSRTRSDRPRKVISEDRPQSPTNGRRRDGERRRREDTDRKKSSRSTADEYSKSARRSREPDGTEKDRTKQSSSRARSSRGQQQEGGDITESIKMREPTRGSVPRTLSGSKRNECNP
jgi:hypothetical protein